MDFFDGITFSASGSEPQTKRIVQNNPRYYGIQFNYSGPLYLQIDHRKLFKVEGAYVFLTYPGHFFEYGAWNNLPRHHNFICTYGPRIERYIAGGLFPIDIESPLTPIRHSEKFFRNMQELIALTDRPGAPPPRAVLIFEDLLLQIVEARQAEHRNLPYQTEQLQEIIRQINNTPEKDWDFAAEAARLNVTPTHFRRIFKSVTDLPPQQFLLQTRLNKAAELLKLTTKPIKEIAVLCGWDNVFYFSRIFRQKYHISPLQYRKLFISFPL